MPPKITINGKEVDLSSLPPEWRDLSRLPPELRDLLEDKNNDGLPDIADNPFAALAKLGKFAEMAKDMPVLLSQMKTQVSKKELKEIVPEDTKQQMFADTPSPGQPAPVKKRAPQIWPSSSPPIKKDTGRKVLFIVVILGLIGWYAYRYLV